MGTRRIFRLLVPSTIAIGLLFLISTLVLSKRKVSARPSYGLGNSGREITGKALSKEKHPEPDQLWLDLVRAQISPQKRGMQVVTPTINVNLTDGFIAGHVPLPVSIVVSVTRQGEHIAHGSALPVPDGNSFFYFSYPEWIYYGFGPGYYSPMFEIGDVVWLSQAGSVVSMTLPVLTALGSFEGDEIYGQVVENSPVTVYLFPNSDSSEVFTRTVVADGAGNYQASWAPTYNLKRRDSGYAISSVTPRNRAYRRFVTPLLRAQVGGDILTGWAPPMQPVSITVMNEVGQVVYSGVDHSSSDGWFEISFQHYYYDDPPGNLILSEPGYQLIAETPQQVFSMTVSQLDARVNASEDGLSGEAAANSFVQILHFPGPLVGFSFPWDDFWTLVHQPIMTVTADLDGYFQAAIPFERGNFGAVRYISADGHQTYARYAVPYISVMLGEHPDGISDAPIQGQIDDMLAPILIEIQGPSGYLKDMIDSFAYHNGYFATFGRASPRIDPGDIITVTSSAGLAIVFQAPELTAQADSEANIVTGTAPPGRPVIVSVSDSPYYPGSGIYGWPAGGGDGGEVPSYNHTIIVTSTAQGTYAADFSSLGGFDMYVNGLVEAETAQGDRVARRFRALPECPPALVMIQVGGNVLEFLWGGQLCEGTVRLRDPMGNLKVEAQLRFYGFYSRVETYFIDEQFQPVVIMPGDLIEVQAGGIQITEVVPPLSIEMDPDADLISGQAPPGVDLSFVLYDMGEHFGGDTNEPYTTTVDSQGHYSLSLAGEVNLRPGSFSQVSSQEQIPRVSAYGGIPFLWAELFKNVVQGWLPPLTFFTSDITETTRNYPFPYPPPYDNRSNNFGVFGTIIGPLLPDKQVRISTSVQSLQMQLPLLSASVDLETELVTGQAPANADLLVQIQEPYDWYWYQMEYSTTANLAGQYSVTVPGISDFEFPTGRLVHTNDDGYQTTLEFPGVTPYFEVMLDDSCISGAGPTFFVPISITLHQMDIGLTEIVTATTWNTRNFYACFTSLIRSNNLLVLEDPTLTYTFTVPALSANYLPNNKVVEGVAPPESPLNFTLYTISGGSVDRRTVSGPDGHYGIDLSDLDLRVDSNGRVLLVDDQGNKITRWFVQGAQLFFPFVGTAP